jgi:hypothetical protein
LFQSERANMLRMSEVNEVDHQSICNGQVKPDTFHGKFVLPTKPTASES